MKIQKHTLDGGDHYTPQNPTGTTNQERIDEIVALSATDGGYIVDLGEFSLNGETPTVIYAYAITGTLVKNTLQL